MALIGAESSGLKKMAISTKYDEGYLYVNTSIANGLETDMKNQLNAIKAQTKQAHKLCKKAEDKKEVSGELEQLVKKAKGGLKKRATDAETMAQNLVTQYTTSVQEYVIKTLQESVDNLNKRVAELEKTNS